jgi:hypothetical protein
MIGILNAYGHVAAAMTVPSTPPVCQAACVAFFVLVTFNLAGESRDRIVRLKGPRDE